MVTGGALRVVSWNVRWCTRRAVEVGGYLAGIGADLLLLQEVNESSVDRLLEAAGARWSVRSSPPAGDPAGRAALGRRRLTLIAGRTGAATELARPAGLPLPERVTFAGVHFPGWQAFTAVSYHAPPGVNWKIAKARQAVATAHSLRNRGGPIILGADANTPALDPVDPSSLRTHWPTDAKRLNGEPGDDVLWGPDVIHHLRDSWRLWLSAHPEHLAALDPSGPLAVSCRTGARRDRVGTPRRYDSIWLTDDLSVVNAFYDTGIMERGLSDHAPVAIDLRVPDASLREVLPPVT